MSAIKDDPDFFAETNLEAQRRHFGSLRRREPASLALDGNHPLNKQPPSIRFAIRCADPVKVAEGDGLASAAIIEYLSNQPKRPGVLYGTLPSRRAER